MSDAPGDTRPLAVVTGASRGFGLEVARALAAGVVVNITSRLASLNRQASGEYRHLSSSYAYRITKAAQNSAWPRDWGLPSASGRYTPGASGRPWPSLLRFAPDPRQQALE